MSLTVIPGTIAPPRLRRWLPPFLAAGFVMAGYFKGTAALATLPFDLTAALAVLTVVVILARTVRGSVPSQVHGVLVAFLLLLPAAFFAHASEYSSDKVLRLFTLTLLATLAPILLIRTVADAEKFIWAWTAICGLAVARALIDPRAAGAYAGAPVTADGLDTTDLGDASALVLVVIVLAFLWNRIGFFLAVAIGAPAGYVLLQSGSRAPLLAAVVAVVAGAFLARARPHPLRAAVVVGFVGCGLAGAYALAPYYAQERIRALFEGGLSTDVGTRADLFRAAWLAVRESPLGLGWGGFQTFSSLTYDYPHNLVLEVLAEAGVILGGLFLVWVAARFWLARRETTSFAGAAAFAIFAFMLVAVLVSGDINSNRLLFFVIGIAIALGAVRGDRTPGSSGDAHREPVRPLRVADEPAPPVASAPADGRSLTAGPPRTEIG
jgi:O-antigen ligase